MKKRLFPAVILIVTASLAFWAGKNVSESNCTKSINEDSFLVDPKYLHGSEFSFQALMANVIQDSLKKLKPPFTSEKLNALIGSIEEKQRLKNYIKLINVTPLDCKIIVTRNDMAYRSGYLLITKDSWLLYEAVENYSRLTSQMIQKRRPG